MRIENSNTDATVQAELGRRIARTRLARDWSQARLAEEAGLGRATVERLELGEPSKLATLIRVLRALDMLSSLDRLLPEPPPSPIAALELAGRQRRRSSGQAPAAGEGRAASPSPGAWSFPIDPER